MIGTFFKKRREKRRLFDATVDVLDGRRQAEASPGAFKLLGFMLEQCSGCDVLLTPTRFEARFGWHPGPHPYVHEIAPGVVAQLMAWAKVERVEESLTAQIGGTGEVGAGPYAFELKPHHLVLRRLAGEKIVIRLSPAED